MTGVQTHLLRSHEYRCVHLENMLDILLLDNPWNYYISVVWVVHDDIDASIQEEVEILISISELSLLYWEFEGLKNDIQYQCRLYKIIHQLQIGLEISLFSKIEHCRPIAWIKFSSKDDSFNTLQFLYIYIYIYIYWMSVGCH